jgi:replication factor C subunit 1
MDEVDGMSSGDRGGITAIISMIKSTKVPIICICNDRSSDKIRSLAGHCLDVKFIAPNKAQVVRRLM